MKIHVTARNLKSTNAINDYLQEKVGKAQRYFSRIVWAQVSLEVEKKAHRCNVVLHAPGETFRAEGRGQDIYAAIDLASDRVDAQLKKYKERLKGHHKQLPPEEPEVQDQEQYHEPVRFSVIKRVPVFPTSAESAVEQMENLGFNFWLYMDRGSGQINVVYKRLDESYGLLQPVKQK